VLLFLGSVAPASHAAAPDARSAAAAEALYREGKRLLVEGRAELACGKLETSQALDPAIGTLLLLGHCYEQVGKSASAWATFRSAESLARVAGQLDRAEIARVRADSLEPRLPRLQIVLPSDIETRSWSIREDERALSPGVLGAAIPVDPGVRRVEASAPGHQSWSALVTVPPGAGVTTVQVPVLAREPSTPNLGSTTAMWETPQSGIDMDAAIAAPADSSASLRGLSYAALGVGVAALAVGATYGVIAQSRYDASLAACRTETLCSPRGVVLRESAETHARVATVAAISGAVFSTGGLVGWLLTRERAHEPKAATIDVGAAVSEGAVGIEARGRF
jgi:hypothetical protein